MVHWGKGGLINPCYLHVRSEAACKTTWPRPQKLRELATSVGSNYSLHGDASVYIYIYMCVSECARSKSLALLILNENLQRGILPLSHMLGYPDGVAANRIAWLGSKKAE